MVLFSCQNKEKKQTSPIPDENEVRAPLLKANQHMVRNEDQLIDSYISRYQLDMQKNGSGLRYKIQKVTGNRKIVAGNKVRLEYTVSLIDGTKCYDSSIDGPLEFIVGKSQIHSGLDEAILLLKEGEQAKIIVPSHLAFGLLGDGIKIPARSTLVYQINDIKVILR